MMIVTPAYVALLIFLITAVVAGYLKRRVEKNSYKRHLSLFYIGGAALLSCYYIGSGLGLIPQGEPFWREFFRYSAFLTFLGVVIRDIVDFLIAVLEENDDTSTP